MAILLAARHTEILGITTVSGNAPLAATTRNALICTQILGIDVPVHAGAARPLLITPRYATDVHGVTGLDGPTLPTLERRVASDDAVGFIIDTLRRERDVWLVPIGPLTNIALALRQAPDIAERIKGISLMGGSSTVGNITPVAEFNLWADPHAAAIVYESGAHLQMCGLNLTQQFWVDGATIAALRGIGNTAATFAADLFAFYVASSGTRTGLAHAPLHDVCAVLALTHPELLRGTQYPVTISTAEGVTRGMTVVDQRNSMQKGEANCLVFEAVDRERGMEVFLAAVAAFA